MQTSVFLLAGAVQSRAEMDHLRNIISDSCFEVFWEVLLVIMTWNPGTTAHLCCVYFLRLNAPYSVHFSEFFTFPEEQKEEKKSPMQDVFLLSYLWLQRRAYILLES